MNVIRFLYWFVCVCVCLRDDVRMKCAAVIVFPRQIIATVSCYDYKRHAHVSLRSERQAEEDNREKQ